MDLVLFGIQGCGKGTQAKRLCEEFGFSFFEAGGQLRKIAEKNTHLGDQVQSYIHAGHLVPHDIIMQVVREFILSNDAEKPILFDGIPRDAEQKADFDSILGELGREFTGVQIMLDEEEAFARIQNRAKEEGRIDDSDETKIRRRMRIFHEKTEPVLTEYKSQGKLIEVDGAGSVDDVYKALKSALHL